ncbi:MAG: GldG family protein [Myxococcota bacterium]
MKQRDQLVMLLSTIGSLVCLNVLSVQNFFRVDLTGDRVFTLSEASANTVAGLEDPITVTAYFTKNLPPPFSQNSQYVRDLLEEYRAASKGLLSYEFIDPESAETEEDRAIKKDVKVDIFGRRLRDKTSIEEELERVGVAPVEIRVIEDDQAQTKRAYMGVVVRYGEKSETLPVIQSTADLEYNLTTLIRNLTRTRVPVLGVVQGHGEFSLEEDLSNLRGLLEQVYEVKPLDLKQATGEGGAIDDSFDALLVLGPKEAYGADELKAIDAFLMKGRSAAFLLDQVSVDLRTFQTTPVEHGLADLLASYGVELGSQLVADVSSASLSVQRRMGPMMVNMPLRYPFIPMLPRLEGDSPLTRGIGEVTLPFPTPLYLKDDVTKEGAKAKGTILARSTEKSWLEDASPMNLSPQRFLERVEASFTGPYNVMASIEGELTSPYGNAAPADAPSEDGENAPSAAGKSRVLVVGSGGLVRNEFLSEPNAALMLNIVDWLLLDPALLGMRTRGLIDAPLAQDLPESTRNVVKYGNAAVVPLLLVLYGLFRWRQREARRRRLNQSPVAA